MNAQQLKNAILQEAIEGRLVPQDPNDEPASALLARIRKEKERLVKEGKLKKKDLEEKPISEDEVPFEIPETWEWVRFFSVYNLETNLVPPQQYLSYNHVAPDNIEKGTGRLLHCNTVKEDKVKSNNHLFYEGQIVYSKIRPLLRKAIIAPFDGLCSADMYPLSTEMHSKYALLYLLSDIFNKQVSVICSSRVKMPKINQNELSTILVPLPPLAEQHRIVAKIEELLPKVEEYGKAQEALNNLNAELPERLKKSILQEAIEGRLVPQDPNDEPASVLLNRIREEKQQLVKEGKLKKKDLEEKPISEDEIPFEIPESWEWCRLGDIIEFVNGRAYKKDELLDRGKYKVLRVGNFFTNDSWYYSDLELPEEKYCYRGDLLYAWSASFGPKIWDGEKTVFHYHIWNVKFPHSVLWREYLYYFFLADRLKIKQSTTGSTMIHVSMENMKPRLIPIPPLAEQHRIVEKLEQVLGEIDKLKE